MAREIPIEAREVLKFWFGEIQDGFCVEDRAKLWFRADSNVDREIRRRFGALLRASAEGERFGWGEVPEGRLALIVLLDQFSRNVYRGRARAFAQDELAVQVCLEGMELSHDRALEPIERSVYYLPLEHSENLAHQELCVSSFERMIGELPPGAGERLAVPLEYAVRHRDIVRRFGRFPHRNQILGRESSDEERRYLEEGGATFGQSAPGD